MGDEMNTNVYLECISEVLDYVESRVKEFQSDMNCIQQMKGDRDYALDVDYKLEEEIAEILMRYDRSVPVFGEERKWHGEEGLPKGKYWVIDPLDGTVNYSRDLPLWGVSIALIENGMPVFSGLGFPPLNEKYIAAKGHGAFLNGEKIQVSAINSLQKSIVGFGDFSVGENSIEKNRAKIKLLEQLGNRALRIRMPGTAALQLAWVASGRSELSITMSNNSWDVQGGVLIVREAGGEVIDFDGSMHNTSSKYTIATNSLINKAVLELFAGV